MSHHLRRLRDQQLVREHRSAADRRDVYYSFDLPRFHRLYLAAGQRLDPALSQPAPAAEDRSAGQAGPPARVLFLCTHNSARSQMAEGLLRQLGGPAVEAFSAGTEPGSVRPEAIEAMRTRGIDISRQYSKHLNDYAGQSFDFVITVCDRARESCPIFPGQPEQIHWSFPDPSVVNEAVERTKAFEEIARELTNRLHFLLIRIRRERGEAGPRQPRA